MVTACVVFYVQNVLLTLFVKSEGVLNTLNKYQKTHARKNTKKTKKTSTVIIYYDTYGLCCRK